MKSVIVIAMLFTSLLTLGESTRFGKLGFFCQHKVIKAEAVKYYDVQYMQGHSLNNLKTTLLWREQGILSTAPLKSVTLTVLYP